MLNLTNIATYVNDGLTLTHEQAFGFALYNENPEYIIRYADVENNRFCPADGADFGGRCEGCEFNDKSEAYYIELTFDAKTENLLEAIQVNPFGTMKREYSLSLCCLADVKDYPEGFECQSCGNLS